MLCADNDELTAGSNMTMHPPARARSLSPSLMLRQAMCTASRPEEHEVSKVIAGPCSPSAYEIRPDAMLNAVPVYPYGCSMAPAALVTSE